jgi:REP element-mobilizing transposase RayT
MYNPKIHHRRSIRLKGYDYSQSGAYFITICCQDMKHRFGEIENGEMILNEYGKIAYMEWENLTDRFANVALDVFQIMPNHIHGIVVLVGHDHPMMGDGHDHPMVGAGLAPAQSPGAGAGASPARTLEEKVPNIGDIVGAYKSLVFNACLDIYKSKNELMGKLWQRNYYENIIRNDNAYQNISNYIINNPAKWSEDKFHN